jgi:hypothetical protein
MVGKQRAFLCNFCLQISKFWTKRPSEHDFRTPELNHGEYFRNNGQAHQYLASI